MHDAAVSARGAECHQHRLGRGAAAVVQAGVGDVHAGQLGDQRLVLEEDLQVALAGLGLIRRVRRVELAARGDVVDDRRNEMVVAAAAEKADLLAGCDVLAGQRGHVRRQLDLGQRRRNVQRARQPQLGRNLREQLVERTDADRLEHRPLIVGSVQNVGHGGCMMR